MKSLNEIRKEFEKHLDGCKQCEQHPFNLCAEGNKIMNGAFKQSTKIVCSCDECHPELHFGKDS